MGAKNKVIAGDYENKVVMATGGKVLIAASITNPIILSATNVVNYEVMNTDSRKSATSAVGRGLIGNFLVGPIGTVAALSAKNKNTHIVAVEFSDGKRSLLEIDDKIYKTLISALYTYKPVDRISDYKSDKKATQDALKTFKKPLKIFATVIIVVFITAIGIQLLSGESIIVKEDSSNDLQQEYNLLGDKTLNGLEGKCYRVGIEIPDEVNSETISRYFIEKYKDKDMEEVIVYIYEKGHVLEDTTEMNKDAIYELSIYKAENGYSYLLWNLNEDVKVEEGVIE